MNPVRSLWEHMRAQRRELSLAGILGALASLSAVALLGVSGWLIASAAEMPPVLTLTVAAVSVRFLAISRAVLRYVERLIGHDAAFRGLVQRAADSSRGCTVGVADCGLFDRERGHLGLLPGASN